MGLSNQVVPTKGWSYEQLTGSINVKQRRVLHLFLNEHRATFSIHETSWFGVTVLTLDNVATATADSYFRQVRSHISY